MTLGLVKRLCVMIKLSLLPITRTDAWWNNHHFSSMVVNNIRFVQRSIPSIQDIIRRKCLNMLEICLKSLKQRRLQSCSSAEIQHLITSCHVPKVQTVCHYFLSELLSLFPRITAETQLSLADCQCGFKGKRLKNILTNKGAILFKQTKKR